MKHAKSARTILLTVLAIGPVTAFACGEMMFHAGGGLPFQSYLAPRPADVLVLWTDASHDEYYAELERAGHRITLVDNAEDIALELEQNHYDIVIAEFDALAEVSEHVASDNASGPRLLPIVARSLRKSPQVRDRFGQYLVEGASLGQILTVINRVIEEML